MKSKLYKINSHNSTVCGYPGRDFDWSKFDWEQKTSHDSGNMRYSIDSEFIPKEQRGQLIGITKAPEVHTDNFFIGKNCQYLHVPYDWEENGTIYRVRPNHSMCAGQVYRGKLIKKQTAVKIKDTWYWKLFFDSQIDKE